MSGAAATVPWKGLHGDRRIQRELQYLLRVSEGEGSNKQIFDLGLVGDNLFRWRFKAKNFDDSAPGGAQLNHDLQRFGQQYSQDYIQFELIFPPEYPSLPFFLRLISPRMVMYTGHVTIGGSVCIEALVNTGTPAGWQPEYSVESVLNMVFINMIHTEVTQVRTLTGPGGTSGPLRIDFNYGTREYSEHEAQQAFNRTVQNHGWRVQPAKPAPASPKRKRAEVDPKLMEKLMRQGYDLKTIHGLLDDGMDIRELMDS